MAQTLSRAYRPAKFSDVVNQDHIKITLQNEVRLGKIAHAYLFCGSRGIGKTTLARIFAKSVNCQKLDTKTGEPCSSCAICLAIAANNFLDLIEMDAASHTGVDNVRENIIDTARLLPSLGKYKVFIIDEAHMLSTSAFNALLKIIEEPPAHLIFIFATTEAHKMPLTVISRCQRFDFKKIPPDLMVKRLAWLVKNEQREVESAVLEAIVRQSDGALRDAESLLGQILTLDSKKITLTEAQLILPISNWSLVLELATFILNKDSAAGVDLLNKVIAEGIDIFQFTDDLIELWRQLLLTVLDSQTRSAEIVDEAVKNWLQKFKEGLGIEEITRLIELAIVARQQLKTEASIITLPLEIMIVKATAGGIKKNDKSDAGDNDNASGRSGEKDEHQFKFMTDKSVVTPKSLPKKEPELKSELVESDGTMADIHKIWPKVYEKAKLINPTLAFILKLTKPLKMTKNILKVGLGYQLHLKKLQEKKITEQIEEIITSLYGKSVVLEPILIDDEEMRQVKRDGDVTGLLASFGGRVVD